MKVINRLLIVFGLFMSLTMSSCGINSNLMFKDVKGEVSNDSIPLFPKEDYRISIDDKIKFALNTNDGSDIIEGMSGITDDLRRTDELEYLVRRDGHVDLPVLGKVKVAGLSIEECEKHLAKLYSDEYKKPFVQVKVTNQRVIVFPGNGADAQVITLLNSNTTLIEAIAQAGGITERGKSNSIKLMRRVDGTREVYTIDLSTLDGLKYADMVVQANDYIYIEPKAEIGREIVRDVAPIMSLLSSALFIVSAINLLK